MIQHLAEEEREGLVGLDLGSTRFPDWHHEDCLYRLGSAIDSVLATIQHLERNLQSLQSPAQVPLPMQDGCQHVVHGVAESGETVLVMPALPFPLSPFCGSVILSHCIRIGDSCSNT